MSPAPNRPLGQESCDHFLESQSSIWTVPPDTFYLKSHSSSDGKDCWSRLKNLVKWEPHQEPKRGGGALLPSSEEWHHPPACPRLRAALQSPAYPRATVPQQLQYPSHSTPTTTVPQQPQYTSSHSTPAATPNRIENIFSLSLKWRAHVNVFKD